MIENPLTTYTNTQNHTIDIFPHVLIRLGGESYEKWAEFNFIKTNVAVQDLYTLKAKQVEYKENLCDNLFSFISGSQDAEAQNIVQNIRRDIFNERKLKNSKLSRALDALPDSLKEELRSYIALLQNIKEKEAEAEHTYLEELNASRDKLKEIIDSEALKKGLILSSRSLLDRLDSFKKRPSDKFRKKEFQVEQSLLQYLTRMYAKTSPFSTFTNLSMGRIADGNGISITKKTGDDVKGHIRINNYLLKYITDLLKNYRPSYLLLPLRINPTFQNREDHFLYLTNNNNIESFQRIPFNPVVEHIANLVQEHTDGIRYENLITKLADDIDASEEELEGYVKQLIDYGMLEYNIGVSGIDPDWDKKLVEVLAPQADRGVKHIAELISELKEVRSLGDQYAYTGVEERKELLKKAFDSFKNVCMKIHEEAGLPEDERKSEQELREKARKEKEENKDKEQSEETEKNDKEEEIVFKHNTSTYFSYKPEQMFYEDTTREVDASLGQEDVHTIIKELNELLNKLRLFKGNEEEREKMRAYFLNKYGKEDSVDLLTYYEDYFREFKKPEKEREEKIKEERRKKQEESKKPESESSDEAKPAVEEVKKEEAPFISEEFKAKTERIEKWRKSLTTTLKEGITWNDDLIEVGAEAIEAANSTVDFHDTDNKVKSYGAFLQFFYENGELMASVNGTFPGYGKMMSRFLHIFEDQVTTDIRDWNVKQSNDDQMFIEDCDASYFNANLHPPLMPYEIWMPGGHNSLSTDKQIPITDFYVKYDESIQDLVLIHQGSGKKCCVFDLGFQGHMGRSQLFQLLEKFTNSEYLFAQPLVSAINNLKADDQQANDKKEDEQEQSKSPEMVVMPRIVYKNKLVLQRKTWFTPKVLLPQRSAQDSDWTYFMKVNLWRKQHNIPDEVFVYVNSSRFGADAADQEAMKKVTRDDYKPQYVDFTNPLLVNLFEKLADRVPASMKIVEMLPSSRQMLKVDDARFVSEFVVQWYNN